MASGPCLHGCGEDDLVDGVCAEEEGRVEEVLPQRRLLRPTELAVAAGAVVKTRKRTRTTTMAILLDFL